MPLQIRPVRSVAILATITIGVMLLSAASLLLSLRARELKHSRQETVALAQMLMEQTEKSFTSVDLVLQGVQERLASPFGRQFPLDSRMVQLLLNARVSGLKNLSSIFLVDANGQLANSSREPNMPSLDLSDRNYFKVFAQGRGDFTFVDKPTRNRLDKEWTLYVSRRVAAADGQFLGVVVAAVNIPDFEKSLMTMQLDHARPVSLYTSDGTLVASMPRRDSLVGQGAAELAGLELPTGPKQVLALRRDAANGAGEYLVLVKLADFPLMLSVTDVEELSLAPWRETAIPVAVGVLLVSLFTALVSMYLVSKLRRKEALTLALNSANDRYQHTVDSVMDAIVAVDENMSIVLFNPAAELMFGRSAATTVGQSLDVLIPPQLRAVHVSHMEKFGGSEQALPRTVVPQTTILGLRADGVVFPIESTFSKSVVDGHMQLTAVLRDASEKHRAEQELREANRQLRELSNSLTQVREQERTRISRELHDDLGQQLTGLKLSLSWLGNRIKEGRETAAQNVDDMRYQLDDAIASVRRIAAELRPRVLDDRDFAEALTWQTREFTRHSGLEVNLNLQAGARITDNRLATALFRITQEALTNVVRHAQASQVGISLTEQGGWLVLSIRDNGVGFESSVPISGVGLVGMRERSIAIGGVFDIASTAGEGTTVSVSVALASLLATEEAA
jgi:PAS domain S-box-containing protein